MLKSNTVKLIFFFFGLVSKTVCAHTCVSMCVCVHLHVVYLKVRCQYQVSCTLSLSFFFKRQFSLVGS